ncbi:protein of unknown function [Candidatus Methylomirabilis oxygeniifera]|uniref:Uncharacterized protein n=1 Tax=Methylomirabilis oxygeniifera TaxID=671143 RepID=D5MJU7_METO1|nr:protein of unknown function [Candidatus Methylomirabilis oxyfera]
MMRTGGPWCTLTGSTEGVLLAQQRLKTHLTIDPSVWCRRPIVTDAGVVCKEKVTLFWDSRKKLDMMICSN